MLIQCVKAFIIGGALCLIAQILEDKTKLTPARILVSYVVAGVVLTAVGVYEPLVKWAGEGATVPLLGFGYCIANGVRRAVMTDGLLGAFSGGLAATAAGVSAAVFFALIAALIFKPGDKS